MPTISPPLLANLKIAEGCKLIAYRDTKGLWTIGYGHLLIQKIDWTGYEIVQSTADAMFLTDIQTETAEADTLPEWAACDTQCRQDALIECVFNLGEKHWTREFPHARAAIADKQWLTVWGELTGRSPEWIADVGKPRVRRIADEFLNGSYPP
jgi:GH24 family phage-related lysozyme (muramidase)